MIHNTLYRCERCGEVFERPKTIHHYDEPDEVVCPSCECNYFVDVDECVRCCELVPEDELYDGICKDCLRELARDKELAFAYGESFREDSFADGGTLNGLVASAWNATDANNELMKSVSVDDAERFCMGDPLNFAFWIRENDV